MKCFKDIDNDHLMSLKSYGSLYLLINKLTFVVELINQPSNTKLMRHKQNSLGIFFFQEYTILLIQTDNGNKDPMISSIRTKSSKSKFS